jgi:hypothetical protein
MQAMASLMEAEVGMHKSERSLYMCSLLSAELIEPMLATYALGSRQFGDQVLNSSQQYVLAAAVGTRFFVAKANFLTISADSTYSAFSYHDRIS